MVLLAIVGAAGFVFLNKESPVFLGGDEFVGVMRTEGLSEREREEMGLVGVEYQITDFPAENAENKAETPIFGYYLLGQNINSKLLGKCVKVTGKVPPEWENVNLGDTLYRKAIRVSMVEKLADKDCDPYISYPGETFEGLKRMEFAGIAERIERPAPDIGYDYRVKLTKTFVDEHSEAGGPMELKWVTIVPENKGIWSKIEESIDSGREIAGWGYMRWGYAESKYLEVLELN